MSLSLSFKPLPTLHACYSVPIEWSVTGNATAAQQGQVKLVFVSAQSSSAVLSSSTVVASRSTASTSSRIVSSTTARPSTTSRISSSTPRSSTTPASTTRVARRAAPTAFTKTVTTVPLAQTSVGWPTIALPSGTYDLAAYLVPSANAAESIIGAQRGVQVVQGTETGCLVAGPSQTTSAGSSVSSTSGAAVNTGATTNGQAVTDDTSTESSDKGPLIGGIIGAILGALFLAGLAFFLIRRRRRRGPVTSPKNWFRKDGTSDRGVGSAFGHDFGALGSGAGTMDSAWRIGAGEMTQVSAPMDVVRVSGFGGARGIGDDKKEVEKASGEAYGMVPILPRRDTDLSTGSEYPAPFQGHEYPPQASAMEYLASAPAQSPPSDASHEYHHDRNLSESSHTTGQSHIGLLGGPIAFPSSESPSHARRASNEPGSAGRRVSGTPSMYQQRRKSSIAGGGVERSGSVRRKPVPAVEAFEDVGSSPAMSGGEAETSREIVKQKSFVLDVERPLER